MENIEYWAKRSGLCFMEECKSSAKVAACLQDTVRLTSRLL